MTSRWESFGPRGVDLPSKILLVQDFVNWRNAPDDKASDDTINKAAPTMILENCRECRDLSDTPSSVLGSTLKGWFLESLCLYITRRCIIL